MIDRFMLGMGLLQQDDDDLSEDVKEILVQEAEAFLRAGGMVTMDLWKELSSDSRTAFVISGERLRTEQAVKIGLAAQGEDMACRIMASVDGGKLDVSRALNNVLDFAENRLKRKKEVSGERLASL